jgi:hypothetical protein
MILSWLDPIEPIAIIEAGESDGFAGAKSQHRRTGRQEAPTWFASLKRLRQRQVKHLLCRHPQ